MDPLAILTAVANLLPVANQFISAIEGTKAAGVPNEVIAFAENLTPIATQLLTTLTSIRTQTEADHPAVWAAVSSDWNDTFGKAKALGLA